MKPWTCVCVPGGNWILQGCPPCCVCDWILAHQAGEDEVTLSTMGRTYTIDFNAMQQINEDTGTARPVQRRPNPAAGSGSSASK